MPITILEQLLLHRRLTPRNYRLTLMGAYYLFPDLPGVSVSAAPLQKEYKMNAVLDTLFESNLF